MQRREQQGVAGLCQLRFSPTRNLWAGGESRLPFDVSAFDQPSIYSSTVFPVQGLHGQTFGIPSSKVSVEVFPLEVEGEEPPAACCPERWGFSLREGSATRA